MSHFYAAITESARKTRATARGHKSTGISAYCASYAGRITTYIRHDVGTNSDKFEVWQETHEGSGISKMIASGIVGEE